MVGDKTEKILNKIGEIINAELPKPIGGTLLYVEIEYGFISSSLFKDIGNQVLYIRDMNDYYHLFLDLWDQGKRKDRWNEMAFFLHNDKFEVTYIYPNEFDPTDDPSERRDISIRRYFGEKIVIYPSIEDIVNT